MQATDLTEKYTSREWTMNGQRMNPNMAFLTNEIDKYRIFVLQGGTRSGKTFAVLQFIWKNMEQFSGAKYSIVRQSLPVLRGSVIPDFVEIGTDAHLYNLSNHNLSNQIYNHKKNELGFFSGDDYEKVKGRKQDVLYLNEGPEIDWESVSQLFYRTSGKIIIDYNPSDPDSWVYDKVLNSRNNVAFLRTTYHHNPFLSSGQLEEMEWRRLNDPEGYLIYGLGMRGEIQGQVYTHFKRIRDDQFPKSKQKIFVMDFGFSPDPTCIIQGHFEGRTVYVKELVYEQELHVPDILIHLFFLDYREDRGDILVGDSAGKSDIAEIRNGVKVTSEDILERMGKLGYGRVSPQKFLELTSYVHNGVSVVSMRKPSGSRIDGVKQVKSREILITEGSSNAWREYSKYRNKKDGNSGRFLNEPKDGDDHFMDCLRYLVMGDGRFYNY